MSEQDDLGPQGDERMIFIFLFARRAFDHRAHWVDFPVFINLVHGHAVVLVDWVGVVHELSCRKQIFLLSLRVQTGGQ